MSENVSLNTDGVLLSEQRFLELCEAERKLAELQERERWIPVTERLPENDEFVFIAKAEAWVSKGLYVTERKRWELLSHDVVEVTHWRPLPAPPKEGENE